MIEGGGLNAAGDPAHILWFVHADKGLLNLPRTARTMGARSLSMRSRNASDPCHGAIDSLDGHVLHGPATAPLAHLGWRRAGATRIAVQSLSVARTRPELVRSGPADAAIRGADTTGITFLLLLTVNGSRNRRAVQAPWRW